MGLDSIEGKVTGHSRLGSLLWRQRTPNHLHSVQRGMEFFGMRIFPSGSQLTRRSRRRFV